MSQISPGYLSFPEEIHELFSHLGRKSEKKLVKNQTDDTNQVIGESIKKNVLWFKFLRVSSVIEEKQ